MVNFFFNGYDYCSSKSCICFPKNVCLYYSRYFTENKLKKEGTLKSCSFKAQGKHTMLDYTANSSHQDKQQKQQTSHELTEHPREPVLYLHRCSSSLTDLWSSLLHMQEETLRLNQQDNITICDLKQEPVAKQNSETTSRASSPTPIPLGNSYSENSSISEPNVVGRGSGRVRLSLHH